MLTRSRGKPPLQGFRIDNDEFFATTTHMRFRPQCLNSSFRLPKFQLFFYESVQNRQKKYQRACAYQHHHDPPCNKSAHANFARLYRDSTMPGVRVQSRLHKEFVKIKDMQGRMFRPLPKQSEGAPAVAMYRFGCGGQRCHCAMRAQLRARGVRGYVVRGYVMSRPTLPNPPNTHPANRCRAASMANRLESRPTRFHIGPS
jgi:hypothetical protein